MREAIALVVGHFDHVLEGPGGVDVDEDLILDRELPEKLDLEPMSMCILMWPI